MHADVAADRASVEQVQSGREGEDRICRVCGAIETIWEQLLRGVKFKLSSSCCGDFLGGFSWAF